MASLLQGASLLGRISKKDQAIILERQAAAARNIAEAATVVARTVITESLYIALMADLFLVSGRVLIWEPGVTGKVTWLGRQRIAMINSLGYVRGMAGVKLPFTDLKPLGWAVPFLDDWIDELNKNDPDDANYYNALDPAARMMLTLMVPGLLRMGMKITRQIIEVAKP